MRIYRNYVLVKATPENNKKGNIYIDPDINPGYHANVIGEVLEVPERLEYYGDKIEQIRESYEYQVPYDVRPYLAELNMRTLNYDTDLEIQKGDTIIFFFRAIQEAIYNGLVAGKYEFMIPYDRIYVAIRNGEIIPVNGTVLIEPLEEDIRTERIILPEKKKRKDMGVVRYIGKPLRGYYMHKGIKDDDDIRVGDVVLFNKAHAKYLETEIWATLPMMYCMKRKEIYGYAV